MTSHASVERRIALAVLMAVALSATATARAQSTCVDGRVPVEGGYCCWPGQSATAEGSCIGPPACPEGFAAAGADCIARTPAPAAAACMEGRVAVAGGYCCWPGQSVSTDGRCGGPPSCPAGRVASGAECAPVATPAYTPAGYGVMRDGSFESSERPREPEGNQVREGLLAGGITLILVGWLGSGITVTIGGAGSVGWPFGWLPLLHPLAAVGTSDGTWGLVAGIVGGVSVGMEIAGIIMAIVGQIGSPREPASASGFSFRLGAPNADGGVSGVLTF